MKVLLIEPHPDDIALNCSGYILKNNEDQYAVALMSHCETPGILDEWAYVMDELNIRRRFTRYFERRKFNEVQSVIVDWFYAINQEYNPDLILCPSPTDLHPDHRVANGAAVAVFGKEKSILFYGNHNYKLDCNYFCLFDSQVMDFKQILLAHYKSQQHRPYFHPDVIRSGHLHQRAGQYSEGFKVYKLMK